MPADRRRAFLESRLSALPLERSTILDLLAAFEPADGPLAESLAPLELDALPAPGDRVGNIRIEAVLGEGGMGAVFRGWDEKLERRVAVKTVHSRLHLHPAAKARFLREARALSRLNHPAICQVYDLVEKDDRDYLILELVDGQDLRSALGDLDHDTRLRLVEQVARALAVTHREGIVHRDLKPANVMVTPDGTVKVLDFGIARLGGDTPAVASGELPRRPSELSAEGTGLVREDAETAVSASFTGISLTRPGHMLGTAAYMSPEQARGEATGTASDVFSLGVLLHEALSSRPPHPPGLQAFEVVRRVAEGRVDAPRDVPAGVEAVIRAMLDPNPEGRPTADAVADQLRRLREEPAQRRLRRRRIAAGAGIALLLCAASVTTLVTRWQASRRTAEVERFVRETEQIAWRLRTDQLSPVHDARPEIERARQQLEELEARLLASALDTGGAASFALGRARADLGELESARQALERAWERGHRTPDTSWMLGRVYAGLYQRELAAIGSGDDPLRRKSREVADESLRAPAIRHLRASEGAELAPPELIAATLAFAEERWDDVLATLEGLETPAWFWESRVLTGDAIVHRGRKRGRDRVGGDPRDLVSELEVAANVYERAATVGRSVPIVHARLCLVAAERLLTLSANELRGGTRNEIDAVRERCATALEVDADASLVLLSTAAGRFAEGRTRLQTGDDPEPAYREALDLLARVPRDETDPGERLRLRGQIAAQIAWRLLTTGGDPEPIAREAVRDLEVSLQHRPDHSWTTSYLANAAMALAYAASFRGEDPTPHVQGTLDRLESLLARNPDQHSLHSSTATLLQIVGRFRRARGADTVALFERALRHDRIAAAGGAPSELGNLSLGLSDLGLAIAQRGGNPEAAFAEAEEVAGRAIEENPGWSRGYAFRGDARWHRATWRMARGEDPTADLVGAREDKRKGLEIEPRNLASHDAMVALGLLRARLAVLDGRDAEPALREAEEHRQRARELRGATFHSPLFRAGILLVRAYGEERAGRDPGDTLEEAGLDANRAAEAAPDDPGTWRMVAEVLLARVRRADRHGEPLDELRDEGLHAAGRALELDPSSFEARAVRAGLLATDPDRADEATRELRASPRSDDARRFLERWAPELADLPEAAAS